MTDDQLAALLDYMEARTHHIVAERAVGALPANERSTANAMDRLRQAFAKPERMLKCRVCGDWVTTVDSRDTMRCSACHMKAAVGYPICDICGDEGVGGLDEENRCMDCVKKSPPCEEDGCSRPSVKDYPWCDEHGPTKIYPTCDICGHVAHGGVDDKDRCSECAEEADFGPDALLAIKAKEVGDTYVPADGDGGWQGERGNTRPITTFEDEDHVGDGTATHFVPYMAHVTDIGANEILERLRLQELEWSDDHRNYAVLYHLRELLDWYGSDDCKVRYKNRLCDSPEKEDES